MRTIRVLAAVVACVLGLISCNTDPNVAKKRYVEMGNKYFDHANYKSASIMYRRALEKDKLYGPAYYKLGLTYQKQGSLSLAVANFRKAVDQLTKDNPDHWDALSAGNRYLSADCARSAAHEGIGAEHSAVAGARPEQFRRPPHEWRFAFCKSGGGAAACWDGMKPGRTCRLPLPNIE